MKIKQPNHLIQSTKINKCNKSKSNNQQTKSQKKKSITGN